ncbi:hypothetical protein BUALT_Bualt07G0059600 [Buddleja alternifolia]|uniref:Pectinesterase inhibitor domain-containing protein n=1 Tax=Buddleja alternifolia TaxID=168488 RepID=A0AAV6XJB4_9LAMI|nr:hypothetical protein BUALT_Bualt07G0059600 [Buddleja alternifolia]
MEPAKNNRHKTMQAEEDATLSKFRRRNKILIIIFLSFFISLILIISALIIHLMHVDDDDDQSSPQSDDDHIIIPHNPAIQAYYSSACYTHLCRRTLNSIFTTNSISDPNQIFTLSLQTASKHLRNLTSLISSNSVEKADITFKKCSNFLGHAMSRINDTLAIMRVNPFVGWQSDEQRSEMMNWIMAVEENLESCIDDLRDQVESTAVSEVRGKVSEVQVYVSSSGAFLLGYAEIMQEFWSTSFGGGWGMDFKFAFGLYGLQLVFIVSLFWSLFRSR